MASTKRKGDHKMNIEMTYHSRQYNEQIALNRSPKKGKLDEVKERQSIAMGNAHRNNGRTKCKALRGRNTDFALSGLMLNELCHDRALPYPNDYKAFSLIMWISILIN